MGIRKRQQVPERFYMGVVVENIVRKKGDAMQFLSFDDDEFTGRETGRDRLTRSGEVDDTPSYAHDPENYQARDADESRGVSIRYLSREERASDNFRWG